MILHLVLGALLLGAILPSLAAPSSTLRRVRFLFVFALYPLFVVLALTQGLVAAVLWIALTSITLTLELVADRVLPTKDLEYARWKTLLLWPVMLPAVLEALLIHLDLAPRPPPVTFPAPPRGSQLFAQSDDELLLGVYQILAGSPELTEAEQTIWLAESFSREIHGGRAVPMVLQHSGFDAGDGCRTQGRRGPGDGRHPAAGGGITSGYLG